VAQLTNRKDTETTIYKDEQYLRISRLRFSQLKFSEFCKLPEEDTVVQVAWLFGEKRQQGARNHASNELRRVAETLCFLRRKHGEGSGWGSAARWDKSARCRGEDGRDQQQALANPWTLA
jgi:hypothetical protein